MRLRLIVE